MTPGERNEYRERMRSAATEQERERIRAEHHARMQERAKERGATLPDQPRGSGTRGMGAPGAMEGGGGIGPGAGTGPGDSATGRRGRGR
jgi:hypothetical protein